MSIFSELADAALILYMMKLSPIPFRDHRRLYRYIMIFAALLYFLLSAVTSAVEIFAVAMSNIGFPGENLTQKQTDEIESHELPVIIYQDAGTAASAMQVTEGCEHSLCLRHVLTVTPFKH